MWTRKRLLLWGKTYPSFSKKYFETVCTGALEGDTGRLVRIYPLTLRFLKHELPAYRWIEADIRRNDGDYRPESFQINQDTIDPQEQLGTTVADRAERARLVLASQNVFRSVESLQARQEIDRTSLGLIRPKEVRRIYKRMKPESARKEWEDARALALAQKELFVDADSKAGDLEYCDGQYRAEFDCDDPSCSGHDFGIMDWGVYVHDRRQRAKVGAAVAEQQTIEKIEKALDPAKNDAHLFLGNTMAHPHTFMIVGFFCPPRPAAAKPGSTPSASLLLPGFD